MTYIIWASNKPYKISPRGLRIGRGPGNDIALDDGQVSQRHARVWLQADAVYIQDMGSTNGIFVNEQKITGPHKLLLTDQLRIGSSALRLTQVQGRTAGANAGFVPFLLGIGGLLLVGILVITSIKPPPASDPLQSGFLSLDTPIPQPSSTPDAHAQLERARLATVLIVTMDGDEVLGTGSGSIVDPRGYILTNYHVIEGGDSFQVGVNSRDENQPPALDYFAELEDYDLDLDLALLRIDRTDSNGALPDPFLLTAVPIGDSDAANIGDQVRILGFPSVGGDTLTVTSGAIAGFHDDGLGHARGWIKTDAEISPGNSGGMVVNTDGEFIGVPTSVFSENRTLGRIGGVRPINLAQPLLRQIPQY